MNRHRAARGSRRWVPHVLAGSASAAGIALVVLFGDWTGHGALVQPFHDAPPSPATSLCVPTTSTTAEGRTWHGCWPTFATSPSLPSPTRTAPSSRTTTDETPPEAVLPTADPFAEES